MAIAFSNSFQKINEGGKRRVRLLCLVITKCRRTVSSELKNLYLKFYHFLVLVGS